MRIGRRAQVTDRWNIPVQPDGSLGACYFCGATVRRKEDFAILAVERVEPTGEPIHSVCHGACAERAKRI